ncbi:hypothetical protein [Streptomyces sp. NPDC087300]|uniref:hypothetical protein n=1 Tax=Streptomyces sp. NPDC087300 TaxID=3365780 RepID=UPI0038053D5B
MQPPGEQPAQAEVADEVPGAAGPAGVLQEFGYAVGVEALGAALLHGAHQRLGALHVVRHRQVGEQVEPVAPVFRRQFLGTLAAHEFVDEHVGHRPVGDGPPLLVLARGHPGAQDRPVGALLGRGEGRRRDRLAEPRHEQRAAAAQPVHPAVHAQPYGVVGLLAAAPEPAEFVLLLVAREHGHPDAQYAAPQRRVVGHAVRRAPPLGQRPHERPPGRHGRVGAARPVQIAAAVLAPGGREDHQAVVVPSLPVLQGGLQQAPAERAVRVVEEQRGPPHPRHAPAYGAVGRVDVLAQRAEEEPLRDPPRLAALLEVVAQRPQPGERLAARAGVLAVAVGECGPALGGGAGEESVEQRVEEGADQRAGDEPRQIPQIVLGRPLQHAPPEGAGRQDPFEPAHLVHQGRGPGEPVAGGHGREPRVQPRHGDPAAVAAPVAVLRGDLAQHLGDLRPAPRPFLGLFPAVGQRAVDVRGGHARPEPPAHAPQQPPLARAGPADEDHHGQIVPVEQFPLAPRRGPAEQPGDQAAVVQQLIESEFVRHGPSPRP